MRARNSLEDGDEKAAFKWNKQHGEACVASDQLHSSSEQIWITNSSTRGEEACGWVFDGWNVVFFHDRLSILKTDNSGNTGQRQADTSAVNSRGVKFEEAIITIHMHHRNGLKWRKWMEDWKADYIFISN